MNKYRLEKYRCNYSNWNNFIENNVSLYTIASNPSIVGLLEKSFNWMGENLFIYNGSQLIGVFNYIKIDNKTVSIPHFSYGGLLVSEEYNSNKEDIYNAIYKYLDIDSFEIRSFEKISNFYNDDKVTNFLYLQDSEDKQLNFFKSKLRSQIKKGYKNGLIGKYGGKELLDDFYHIYSSNMHALGSPVLGKYFFKNVFQNYKYGDAKIFCIYFNDKVIASSLVLSYLNFSEVCWASTLREYNKLSPNMVLYWEMIKYAVDNNKYVFSFGRGSKDGSTNKFKKQWGAEERQLYFNYSEKQTAQLKKMKFLSKIWSKLPLSFVNYLGPKIARRLY
jgi:FemAB-related protein (PEP-CTERM system-associated)